MASRRQAPAAVVPGPPALGGGPTSGERTVESGRVDLCTHCAPGFGAL